MLRAFTQIHFAMLFGEAGNFGLGEFDDVAEAALFLVAGGAIVAEGFGAGVDDAFAGDGVADDGHDDRRGTILEFAPVVVKAIGVVVKIIAGTDFSELWNVM